MKLVSSNEIFEPNMKLVSSNEIFEPNMKLVSSNAWTGEFAYSIRLPDLRKIYIQNISVEFDDAFSYKGFRNDYWEKCNYYSFLWVYYSLVRKSIANDA